ncbi:MAG: MGMT family protein [Candidatus Micrarchaeota archaeon]
MKKIGSLSKKLEQYALTNFQRAVLMEVAKIPRGKVMSYKQIAQAIGRPNAYRAVGNALKKNPLPVLFPCHRVIRANGEVGGYAFGGKSEKIRLLEREGSIVQKSMRSDI